MAFDVIERTEHAAGAAFNAIFKRHDYFFLGFFPYVDLCGTDGGARMVVTFRGAGVRCFDLNVGLVVGLVGQITQFFVDVDCGKLLFFHKPVLSLSA